MNFKQETLKAIKESGHIESDVMFIGSSDGKLRVNIETFKKIADFEYDNGLGTQEIAQDLIIYFNDKSYCVRREYDGSEWWEYNTPLNYLPTDKFTSYDKLCVTQSNNVGCVDLEDINTDNFSIWQKSRSEKKETC